MSATGSGRFGAVGWPARGARRRRVRRSGPRAQGRHGADRRESGRRPPLAQRRSASSCRARQAPRGPSPKVADPAGSRQLPSARVGSPRRRGSSREGGREPRSPPERPRTPKCSASARRCRRSNATPKQHSSIAADARPRRRVDRRQRHDPDPDERPGSHPEGDRRRQRDRGLPVCIRRRARVVRRQRLRLLGIGQLCARGGWPAERTGDIGAAGELGRTRPGEVHHGVRKRRAHLHVRGRDPLRHGGTQWRLRVALAGRGRPTTPASSRATGPASSAAAQRVHLLGL